MRDLFLLLAGVAELQLPWLIEDEELGQELMSTGPSFFRISGSWLDQKNFAERVRLT